MSNINNLEVSDYLEYANLQMAAEANLKDGENFSAKDEKLIIALQAGNSHASRFTKLQATQFANEWIAVDQKENSSTGFSGTLFKRKDFDDYVVSFRSTEFIDDAARDNQATNDLEIKNFGFALGQISDMEDWYKSLISTGKLPSGSELSVTGYSLGGHLATVFNRLHMNDAAGSPHIKEVVTFNGAGVGQVPEGATLQSLLDKFNYLRNPEKLAAERFSFTDAKVISVYDSIRNSVANNRPILDSDRTTLALLALDVKTKIPALQLVEAVKRIDTIRTEVERLAHIKSGAQVQNPGELDGPKKIDASEIGQVSLDYQMAVVYVGLPTMAASLVSGGWQAYNGKAYFGTERSANQYDVVGASTPSAVGNSQWHYGADVPIFIEDQPLYRGASPSKAAEESFKYGGGKLLVDGYDKSDFGDTHSLVLLVDSLNVQNLLLGFLPESQRAVGAETLKTIFLAASSMVSSSGGLFGAGDQGKSEGDVLENVLNALAELCAPGAKLLNGSTTGGTWATIVDKDGYTGRDSFYSVIQAIADSAMFKKAVDGSISVSLQTADGDLASRARTDFGAYAALAGLSPFAFSIAAPDSELAEIFKDFPGYADWAEDKATFVKGTETDDYNVTQQWLHDRNEFLKQKSFFNTNNINPVDYSVQQNIATVDFRTFSGKMYFEDVDSGYKIVPGNVSSTTSVKRFYFGDEQSNSFSGASTADHLYGGGGADTLDGMAGNDYLEGGAGSDVLKGGAGADTLWGSEGGDSLSGGDDSDILSGGDGEDTLDGGAGNDQLKGGAGADTYRFTGTYGKDVIDDVGGAGAIVVDGVALHGGKKSAENVYKDQATGWTYAKLGSDLVLTKAGDKDNSIVIKNWSADTGLGIKLEGELPVSKPSTLTGDFEKKIEGGSYVFDDSGINYAGSNVPGASAGAGEETSAGQQGANNKKFNDLLTGGINNDTIIGLTGNDGLDGGAGDDVIDGGVGDDFIFGGAGADTLFGGAGRDWIIGSGNAQFEYPRNADTPGPVALGVEDIRGLNWVTFTKPNGNWSYLGANNTTVVQNDSGNLIDGGSGADHIIAGTGDDYVFGGADNDYIEGQAGIDHLYGGDGADTLCGDSTAEPGLMDTTPAALQVGDLLDGGAGDDNMSGQGGNDTLAGGEGNDSIWGDFDDVSITPISAHGNDHLDGGAGNDQLFGGGRADVVLGGDGDDKLWGDDVQSAVPASAHGDDYLDGGKGRDLLTGGGGNDVLYGSEGNDQLIGDDIASNLAVSAHGNDTLDGGDGADVLFGGGKDDFLVGGEGDDVAFGDDSPDSVLDGASHGRDTLDGGDGADSLFGGGSDDTLMGGAGNDSLVGDDGSGTLNVKWHGNDVLDGGDGADTLVGGGGSDTLFGGDGADVLFGADQSIGASNAAFTGEDVLDGGSGNDTLIGGAGNDLLIGGAGIDYMAGGAGDDTYVIHAGDSAIVDGMSERIVDTEGSNTLVLEGVEGTALAVGTDAAGASSGSLTLQFGSGTSLVIDQGLRGAISYVNIGGEQHDFSQWLQGAMWDGVQLNSSAADQSVYGGRGQDTLSAGADGTLLYGGEGDDWLGFGPSVIDLENPAAAPVGVGIVLHEGDGNDVLLPAWSSSQRTGADANFIQFDSNISASGLRFLDGGNGTVSLGYGSAGDTFNLGDKSKLDANAPLFDELRFGNGSPISWAGLCSAYAANGLGGAVLVIAQPPAPTLPDESHAFPPRPNDDTLVGTAGDDTMNGGIGMDHLDGGAGNDLIFGGDDFDTLLGNIGNDTLDGGLGNDTLYGGTGNNDYLFGKGDGQDFIGYSVDTAVEKINTLKFKAGIAASEVTVTRENTYYLVLSIAGGNDTVTVPFFGDSDTQARSIQDQLLQRVVFADGTVWDAATLTAKALAVSQQANSAEQRDGLVDGGSAQSDAAATTAVARTTAVASEDTAIIGSDTSDSMAALNSFAVSASLLQFHLRDSATAALGSESAAVNGTNLLNIPTAIFSSSSAIGDVRQQSSLSGRVRQAAL